MHKLACSLFLEELSYSGSLHIRHVRISPSLKWEVIEFLSIIGVIKISKNGLITFADSLHHLKSQ